MFSSCKTFLPCAALVLLIAIGGFFRFFEIGEQSLWIDEGFTLTQSSAIARHGYPLLDSGFIEKKDILLPAILSPFSQNVDAFNPTIPRAIVALFGTASILLAFLIGRTVEGNRLAILFAATLTFSFWHIAWSRQVRGYSLAVFFVLIAILFLALAVQNRKPCHLYGAIIAAVFATLSKSFGILFLPTILAYIILSKESYKRIGILIITTISSIGLGFFFFFLAIQGNSSDHPIYLPHYIFGYFWGSYGILLPLALYGWMQSIRKHPWRSFHISLGIFLVISLLFFSFFVYAQENRYLFLTTPLLFLYASFAIIKLSRTLPVRHSFGILLILGAVILIDFIHTKTFLFVPNETFILESGTPQPPFRDAYRFLENKIQPDDIIVSPYPFMDKLYLHQSTYAIPLSYTGRAEDSTIRNKIEYYSGTRSIFANGKSFGEEKILKLSKQHSVYIILDSLAIRRIDTEFLEFIQKNSKQIFESAFSKNDTQKIFIYQLSPDSMAISLP